MKSVMATNGVLPVLGVLILLGLAAWRITAYRRENESKQGAARESEGERHRQWSLGRIHLRGRASLASPWLHPVATASPERPPSPKSPTRATPNARRLAHQRGISLERVDGTGPNGVITLIDVERALPSEVVAAEGLAPLLGVGAATQRLMMNEARIVAGAALPLSLTVDHRWVDGAPATRFLALVAESLAAPDGVVW